MGTGSPYYRGGDEAGEEPRGEAPGLGWVFWLVAGVLAWLLFVVLALVLAYVACVMWMVKWFRG